MLSLTIVFILFGSLVPLMQGMHTSLQLKKERVAAYETLYEGARLGTPGGTRMAEGIRFTWQMTDRLCVYYDNFRNEKETICAG
ncbi:hypothetical protein [Planococcus lenghuensis]|uniref:Type II secretion system protein n=1 Tax=Planococcus lenghuensis TaxID=2213202 RepID=A0A1Q2KXU0_9BACL|nr:hypothetical protein [Planococcus lenghuensis]AQQ53009.1 hypothetical protein B0X71_07830 [Planococcus lenghuensis]